MGKVLHSLDTASLRRPLFLAACGLIAGLSMPTWFGLGCALLLPFARRRRGVLVLLLAVVAGSLRIHWPTREAIVPFGAIGTWKGSVRKAVPMPQGARHAWSRGEAFVDLDEPPITVLLSAPQGRVELGQGDRVTAMGVLERPRTTGRSGSTSPSRGPFDMESWLRHEGARAVLRASRPPRVVMEEEGWSDRLRGLQGRWGRLLSLQIPDPAAAGIARSILLGDRSVLPKQEQRDFRSTGSVYVLVVSGVHVMVLAGMFAWLLGRLRAPRTPVRLALVAFCALYAVVAGAKAPILRAAITLSAFLLAEVAGRPADTLNLLGLAAGLILVFDPSQADDLGFQLSFIAVLALVLVTPALLGPRGSVEEDRTFLQRARDAVCRVFAANLAAWAGTEPLILFRLGLCTPIGLLVNLAMGPLLCLVLASSLLLLAWQALPLQTPAAVSATARFSAWLLDSIVRFGARVPHGCLTLPQPGAWSVWGAYAWLCAGVRLSRRWKRKGMLAGLLLAALTLAAGVAVAARANP